MLDVGCWDGVKTADYGRSLGVEPADVYGVDCFEHILAEARARINASRIDLEAQPLPYEDGFFDVVICNQVFEHLKQIFGPMNEIHRVLAPGGVLIFSVPNLASLHNRILLGLGRQPTSIRVMGPHVRGFTREAVKGFLQFSGLFSIEKEVGVGLYPLPMSLARPFGRALPSLSHTVIFLARKHPRDGKQTWDEAMRGGADQTKFFED